MSKPLPNKGGQYTREDGKVIPSHQATSAKAKETKPASKAKE